MRNRFLVLLTALFIAAASAMPAAASPVSLNCSAYANGRTYSGTITVDSSRLDSLQVGDVVKLRNGVTGTITYVQPSPWQLRGTGTLSSGQSASVSCSQ